MSRVRVQYRTKNTLGKIATKIRWLEKRVQGQLLGLLGKRVAKQTRKRIQTTKAAPDGPTWARRKDKLPHPLLVKSRKMLRSIRSLRSAKDMVGVGSDIGYDTFQNKGTRRGIPARPFYGVSAQDRNDLQTLINDWVDRL